MPSRAATHLIRHLPFFVAAAQEENFQRAAARMGVTQPALSKRIRDLEIGLGVRLFDRGNGRVRLTAEGRRFAEEAERLIDGFGAAMDDLRRTASGAPQLLSIGLNEQAMRLSVITKALRGFRDAHPDIDVTISLMSSAAQLAALRTDQLQLAFLYLDAPELGSVASRRVLFDDPYVLALPDDHALAGADGLSLADLAGEDLIWPSGDSAPALHAGLRQAWADAGVEPHVAVEIESAEAALNAVAAGLGVAVVRASNAGREHLGVVLRPVEGLRIDASLRVAWVEREKGGAAEAFVTHLRREGVVEA